MDVTTQRRFLGAIAAGLFAGSVGVVAWSLSAIESDSPSALSAGRFTPPVERPALADASMDDWKVAARPLRQPLYDPPPEPPAPEPSPVVAESSAPPPPPPRASLGVVLVGTIIQPEQSLAIVANAEGEFDVKGVGESLELKPQGITIEMIESERVTLRYQGRQTTIEIDRKQSTDEESAGNRGVNRRRNNR